MCYDICLRALDETIQTLGSMKYRRAGEDGADEQCASEVAQIAQQLIALRRRLDAFEGAHLDETVHCSVCNTYSHHNHVKTEWRGKASQGGYDEEVTWAVRSDGTRYAMKPSSPYAVR